MEEHTTIGIDIAKNFIQLYGIHVRLKNNTICHIICLLMKCTGNLDKADLQEAKRYFPPNPEN